uniref:NXPE C-terminal domain-containing protein n=1 Tax=Leptobrachium leishanense TaxID=445787 RepID=A0A8C5N016_9ANUR
LYCVLWHIALLYVYIEYLPDSGQKYQPAAPRHNFDADLLNLSWWPDLPRKKFKFEDSTSPRKTQYHILNKQDIYKVGETLEVLITAKDHMGRLKTYGGDLFRAKLHSPKKKAAVTGQIKDYGNGSYLTTFLLPWPGEAQVNVRLIHSIEAIAVLKNKRDKYPEKVSDTVYFKGYFESHGVSDITECNLKVSGKDICEYKDPVTGEIWQCVRPKKLPCDSWRYHSVGGNHKVTNSFETLIRLILTIFSISDLTSKLPSCKMGQELSQPSGYYYNMTSGRPWYVWGSTSLNIYMIGDSTLRQWFEYLENHVLGPLLAVDPDYGVAMRYRAHGLPLKTAKTLLSNLQYDTSQIAQIVGGPYTVVVITLWAHFTSYPLDVYLQRLARVHRAVVSLLTRSPDTTVLIKSANTGYKMVYSSDWLSLQLDVLMRAAFKGMAVTILDVWDMTSCHYLPDDIHPGPPVIRNEVDLMLSYICPK